MTQCPIIRTESGLVGGVASPDGEAYAWLGIPFAAPPIGSLRWRPPMPAEQWDGVRACDRYGDTCVQPKMPTDALMRQFSFGDPPECGTSEDCLYLNVWAPAASRMDGDALPVIVFVFGGGHRLGSGSHPVSRGDHLAAHGAIVVTVNYRLGALGYLAHPALTAESGASGNWACLDLLEALGWVQRNIAEFGGDASLVTLFGQSAGAALINVLMASPRSTGLFQRAVVTSSGRFNGPAPAGVPMKRLDQAEATCAALVPTAHTAEELRALDPLAIDAPRGFWGPIIDGDVLREPIEAVFRRGGQLDIPLLAGYTRNEASPYGTPELHSCDALRAHINKTWGAEADQMLELFPCSDDRSAIAASYALRRDTTFAFQPWRWARLQAKTARSPVYLFTFERAVPMPPGETFHEPVPPGGYGAYHGSELWYVFGTFDALPWPWEAVDRRLGDQMASAWVAFARSGDPNGQGLPPWPEFRKTGEAMAWDERPDARLPFNAAALLLVEKHVSETSD